MTDIFTVFNKMTMIATSLAGHKNGLVTATGMRDWVFLCFAYSLMLFGATILASIMVIQYFFLGILQKAFPAAFEPPQHHCCPRESSARSYRRSWGSNQSQCRKYKGSKSSVWTDGFDHMVTHQKFFTPLGKRRVGRLKRESLGENTKKHNKDHHRNPLPQNHRKNKNPELFTDQNRRISIHHLSKRMSDLSELTNMPATPITIHPVVGIMPRPGQPGALSFDGTGISDFLKDWEMECEEYGLTNAQKCKKLPRYCTKDIGEAIQKLDGYVGGDWTVFQRELKQLFWQTDPPKDTVAALFKLIGDAKAGKMSVDMYVLKYTTITDTLVKKNAMSKFDRTVRLLEGLSDEIQSKVFEYCSEQGWRMLEHDVETAEPVFEDVKKVVLEKAKMFERRKLFVGGRLTGPGYVGTGSNGTPTSSATATTAPTTVPTTVTSPVPTASDSIEELTKQLSKLTLILEGQPQPQQQFRGTGPTQTSNSDRPWQRRCVWCDSVEHSRGKCSEFIEALNAKLIGFNEVGRVKMMSTGEELPLMFNKGGMKEALRIRMAAISADVGAITFDDRVFASLGPQNGSARVTTLDFENGIRTDQIIDVEANEKRKRDALDRTRRVRSRIDESGPDGTSNSDPGPSNVRPTPANYGYPPPVQVTDVPEEEIRMESTSEPHGAQTSSRSPNAQTPSGSPSTTGTKTKFRLASELNQMVTTEEVGKKVMDAPIQLKMCELLAVSAEVSNYIHDQTRKRRVPIANSDGISNRISPAEYSTEDVSANANLTQSSATGKSLYACPSARAKVCLNDELQVESLLDDGSELNIMAKRTFEQLQHPIDTNVNWRINGYDVKAEDEIMELGKGGNLIGVCHDVLVDVGGVAVKQHIFVVKYLNSDLILGRPWGRTTRAQMTNKDDGSYVVKIKSTDGRRIVEFIAVPAQHERIREYVRAPDESDKDDLGIVALKAEGVRH